MHGTTLRLVGTTTKTESEWWGSGAGKGARAKTPVCFPTGVEHATTGVWVAGWKRTYPASMDLSGQDHLAVGSGAWRRSREWEEYHAGANGDGFTRDAQGRWVEDLSGVRFDDVDADYLSYILSLEAPRGRTAVVQKWVAAWARTPEGRYAMGDDVYAGRETGWMYKTLGSLACHRAKRDSDDTLSESGFCPVFDETPDDGRLAGRTWGSADPDWKPKPHEAYAILADVKERAARAQGKVVWDADGGRYPAPHARYETHKAGTFKRVAAVVVRADRGDKAFELPGKWLPEWKDGELGFIDRHAWDAVLWAAGELRELYTRVVENGELCVPDGCDVGPVAWVYETVAGVMAHLPTGELKDARLDGFRAEVRRMANACLDAAERVGRPVGYDFVGPVDELADLDLEFLAKAYCRRVGYRPSRRRVTVTRGRDWACCR
jgi:hypothetical protein